MELRARKEKPLRYLSLAIIPASTRYVNETSGLLLVASGLLRLLRGGRGSGTDATGMADLPAIIRRKNLHRAAHFVKPRAHSLAQTVDERVFS
jgi:hypothetical protein